MTLKKTVVYEQDWKKMGETRLVEQLTLNQKVGFGPGHPMKAPQIKRVLLVLNNYGKRMCRMQFKKRRSQYQRSRRCAAMNLKIEYKVKSGGIKKIFGRAFTGGVFLNLLQQRRLKNFIFHLHSQEKFCL